ncbi:CU044_5270 family protein [Streptomyces sp. NPDC091267]|uniref:CU044_5270 family protein n=1 Tax=Streptomyces sp. NPDC091267 TaxID=3155195 RepID=UPI00342C7204
MRSSRVDDMGLLRQMRAEIPRPDPARILSGRERLVEAINGDPARLRTFSIRQLSERNDMTFMKKPDASASAQPDDSPTRARAGRRPTLRVVLVATAAFAVGATAVSVLDDNDAHTAVSASVDSSRMQRVSVATVLNAAAVLERRQEKTVAPRDDQFIYTKEIISEREQKTGSRKSYVDENWTSVDGSKRSWVMELGKGWWSAPARQQGETWPPADWGSLKKLPTDPDELILAVMSPGAGTHKSVADIKKSEWPDVHFALASLLYRVPVMPEGLRPAAFEALAKIPGVTATSGVKDAKGRAGVAITYTNKRQQSGWDTVLIFAEDTHEFLGFKNTRSSDSGGGKNYDQLSYLDSYAVVDKVKQRP